MNITTKFDIKDKVYVLSNDKIEVTEVICIILNVNKLGMVSEQYKLEIDDNTWMGSPIMLEPKTWRAYQLFKSREELIASL